MNQIMISAATYAKLLRVAEVTYLDPEEWADIALGMAADECIKAAEKLPDSAALAATMKSAEQLKGAEPTEDESTGLQWWSRLDEHARRFWLEQAGDTDRPLRAWEAYKRERGDDDSREMT
jgi:hypothetical protein